MQTHPAGANSCPGAESDVTDPSGYTPSHQPARTAPEPLDGKGIERPTTAASPDDTLRKAPASKKKLATSPG